MATDSRTSASAEAAVGPLLRRSGLRRRLTLALIGLTFLGVAVQSLGLWYTARSIERETIDTLLEHELAYLIETDARSSDAGHPELRRPLRYYRPRRDGFVPQPLIALAPGWHQDVKVGGNRYRVLIRDLDATPGQVDRVYLLYDLSPLNAREARLRLAFVIGLLIVAGLALWASRQLASAALEPLAKLVGQIRALDPETRGRRLDAERDLELGVISDALNGYMAKLDALIERERAFSSAASHELRTPLAVIGGAVELLEAGPADPSRPIARIRRAVAQAEADLDSLLALSRPNVDSRAEFIDLDRRLPEWAELDSGAPARLRWRLTPLRLIASAGSLHVIFSNLLRNALRAAGPDGTVTIELADCRLRLLDDGPGIPADELPRVFEPHFRGRDGGTGIGLYVSQQLARRHGWVLTLANRPGGGAVAELCLAAD